jgi:multicomponent Na+:H+ antiporter subunit B
MIERPTDSIIVQMACRYLAPFIQLYGLYIIAHGHYFPGGGFQGGVIWAASFILLVISYGQNVVKKLLSEKLRMLLAAGGIAIFAGIGIIAMLFGGEYLDYGAIIVPGIEVPYVRYFAILVVEIGIGILVMGAMILIFLEFITEKEYD